MPRTRPPHHHQTTWVPGRALLAMLAVVAPCTLSLGCGWSGIDPGPPLGVCTTPVHLIPSALRIEVGRGVWVQVREGAAGSSDGQECQNARLATAPGITASVGRLILAGIAPGQSSVGIWLDHQLAATVPVQVVAVASGYPVVSVGTCVLTETGSLFCTNIYSGWPTRMPLTEPLSELAGGSSSDRGCGATAGGTVYCWGGGWGQNSPINPSTWNDLDPLATPVRLPVGPAQGVRMGERSACALTSLGRIECWGQNYLGQLGVPTWSADSFSIVTVPTPEHMTAITAGGGHACALDGDLRAWCWGRSGEGQVGVSIQVTDQACNFEYRCMPMPHQVIGDLRFTAIAAGFIHTCAIAVDGTTWCWGANDHGQLGTGDLLGSHEPRQAAVGLSFITLALGGSHSCGLTAGGAIYCWGRGTEGQLGNGTFTDVTGTPVRVQSTVPFMSVSAGGATTCAVDVKRITMCWGESGRFQLGRGSLDLTAVATPTKMSGQP